METNISAGTTLNDTTMTINNTTIGGSFAGVHIPSLLSMIAFYFAILFMGVYASWKNKSLAENSSENVMLAGRDMGFIVGIFTLTATWVGGGFINGTAQAVYETGLVWCHAPIGYTLSLIVSGLFFAKPMRRAGYVTMLDPFQIKYGRVMTALLYIPAVLGDLFWTGAILSALGYTLNVVTGLEHIWSVILSASIAVIYTFLGGLWSVAFTDVIQLSCIFLGLWLVVPFAMTHHAVGSISETFYSDNSWGGSLPATPHVGLYIDVGLLLILGGIPWQVYFQRVLSQRTPERAQALSFLAAIGCFILGIPPVLIGAICKSTAWNETTYGVQPDARMALPLVIQYLTPTAVAVIGLGAVSAAVMSSADSSILSSSSMFARNVYTPLRDVVTSFCNYQGATDAEVLIVMRIAVLAVGAIATVLAVVIKSVYGLLVVCADLMYVVMFPQLLCIIYAPFTNTYGSMIGYFAGMFFRLSGGEPLLSIPPLIKYPYYDDDNAIQLFPFRTLSMLISLSLILLISFLTKALFQYKILPRKADIFVCMRLEGKTSVGKSMEPRNVSGSDNLGYDIAEETITTRL